MEELKQVDLLISLAIKASLEEEESMSSTIKDHSWTLISKPSLIKQGGSRSACAQSFVIFTLVVVAMSLLALLYLHLLDLVALKAHALALGSCNLSLL